MKTKEEYAQQIIEAYKQKAFLKVQEYWLEYVHSYCDPNNSYVLDPVFDYEVLCSLYYAHAPHEQLLQQIEQTDKFKEQMKKRNSRNHRIETLDVGKDLQSKVAICELECENCKQWIEVKGVLGIMDFQLEHDTKRSIDSSKENVNIKK